MVMSEWQEAMLSRQSTGELRKKADRDSIWMLIHAGGGGGGGGGGGQGKGEGEGGAGSVFGLRRSLSDFVEKEIVGDWKAAGVSPLGLCLSERGEGERGEGGSPGEVKGQSCKDGKRKGGKGLLWGRQREAASPVKSISSSPWRRKRDGGEVSKWQRAIEATMRKSRESMQFRKTKSVPLMIPLYGSWSPDSSPVSSTTNQYSPWTTPKRPLGTPGRAGGRPRNGGGKSYCSRCHGERGERGVWNSPKLSDQSSCSSCGVNGEGVSRGGNGVERRKMVGFAEGKSVEGSDMAASRGERTIWSATRQARAGAGGAGLSRGGGRLPPKEVEHDVSTKDSERQHGGAEAGEGLPSSEEWRSPNLHENGEFGADVMASPALEVEVEHFREVEYKPRLRKGKIGGISVQKVRSKHSSKIEQQTSTLKSNQQSVRKGRVVEEEAKASKGFKWLQSSAEYSCLPPLRLGGEHRLRESIDLSSELNVRQDEQVKVDLPSTRISKEEADLPSSTGGSYEHGYGELRRSLTFEPDMGGRKLEPSQPTAPKLNIAEEFALMRRMRVEDLYEQESNSNKSSRFRYTGRGEGTPRFQSCKVDASTQFNGFHESKSTTTVLSLGGTEMRCGHPFTRPKRRPVVRATVPPRMSNASSRALPPAPSCSPSQSRSATPRPLRGSR